MFKGCLYALGACFIWGLVFIIPVFMKDFSSLEITLGRYVFYGLLSCLIFGKLYSQNKCRYPKSIWINAFFFSFLTSLAYYPFVVLSLRCCTPAICALISGITPLTIALYYNLKSEESNLKNLIPSFLLISSGLVIINAPYIFIEKLNFFHFIGILFAFISVASWSFYAVKNANFLKMHPEIQSDDWSTLIGVCTLIWSFLATILLSLVYREELHLERFTTWNTALINFLIGSAILGIICSWLGNVWWNLASNKVPMLLLSQLLIFETIFGMLFAYLVEYRFPSLMEFAGISLLLIAIIYASYVFSKTTQESLH